MLYLVSLIKINQEFQNVDSNDVCWFPDIPMSHLFFHPIKFPSKVNCFEGLRSVPSRPKNFRDRNARLFPIYYYTMLKCRVLITHSSLQSPYDCRTKGGSLHRTDPDQVPIFSAVGLHTVEIMDVTFTSLDFMQNSSMKQSLF